MSVAIVHDFPTYLSAEAFSQFAILDLNSDGKLALAAASGEGQFIANREAFAANEPISVTPTNYPGVLRMLASGAIAYRADVRLAGSGKVNDTAGGRCLGRNVGGATTADGDIVYVLTGVGESAGSAGGVSNKTADYTVTESDSATLFTNSGASGTITFALPAAVVGLKYRFFCKAAQALRIDPNGTETIALPSTGAQSAAGKYIWADAVGEFVEVECIEAGKWEALSYKGTWTAEA